MIFFRRSGLLKLFNSTLRGIVLVGMIMSTGILYSQAQKQWKDQGEYDLAVSIPKAKSPDEQIQLLNQWKEKYPESDYKIERAQAYLAAYGAKNDGAGLYEACKYLVSVDPKSFQGWYYLTALTESLKKSDAAGMEMGVKSANELLGLLDTQFDAAKKPPAVTEAQWKDQRNGTELAALKTLAWVELQKKNFKEAEKFYVKGLQTSPGTALFSSLLATAIAFQKDPNRQAEAMWHFARAGYLDGPGALDPTSKSQTAAYFNRTYKAYAGDDKKEMDEMIAKVKAEVFPPAGFTIESNAAKMAKNAEKFKAENPMLYAYMEIKKALQAADGEAYWANLKDAELPAFKGKLVSTKPEVNPKEIVLAVETADQPEVTLVLEKPLRGKADVGTEIEFTAVAKEYTKEPYSLKLEIENEKLKGWPAQAAAPKAPVKRAAPAKKAAKK
jgi:hypothetical protein